MRLKTCFIMLSLVFPMVFLSSDLSKPVSDAEFFWYNIRDCFNVFDPLVVNLTDRVLNNSDGFLTFDDVYMVQSFIHYHFSYNFSKEVKHPGDTIISGCGDCLDLSILEYCMLEYDNRFSHGRVFVMIVDVGKDVFHSCVFLWLSNKFFISDPLYFDVDMKGIFRPCNNISLKMGEIESKLGFSRFDVLGLFSQDDFYVFNSDDEFVKWCSGLKTL